MATYVLVHGAWHGAWCWHKVLARLEAAGHRVLAPDLLCLGRDRTPVHGISLAQWVEQMVALIAQEPASTQVILVGHSRGGIVISEIAERVPRRIQRLVYLAAFLLPDGESIASRMRAAPASKLMGNIVIDAASASSTVRPSMLRGIFYGSCSDDDVALARLLLQPEPAGPTATALHLSEERFGSVPRTYIECERDQAILIATQREMHAAMPHTQVISMDADHSPFFSAPDVLCAHLTALT